MDDRKLKFLKAVLGEDGAKALAKAAERGPELENALLPRTIMSWLGLAARDDFEGRLPGVENTYLQFSKSEDRFSGSVAVGDEVYAFQQASILHLGACVAVALGADHERVSLRLRDLDIQRLGKNIDLLVKARVAVKELKKRVLDPAFGYKFSHEHHDLGNGEMVTKVNVHTPEGEHVGASTFRHQGNTVVPGTVVVDDDHQRRGIASAMYAHAEKQTGKKLAPSANQTPEGAALWQGNAKQPQFGMAKAAMSAGKEGPGPAHAATQPELPTAPTPPDPTQDSKGPTVSLRPKAPKPPKPGQPIPAGSAKPKAPSLKVTKREADHKCPVCAGTQFKSDRFQGCICFRDLAKNVRVTVLEDGYSLEFKADWDSDSILTLLESLGRK